MKLTVLATLLFVVSLFACEESGEEAVNTLGTDVDVEMKEYLNGTQRSLMFKFFTTRDFSCINNSISYSLQQGADGLAIVLNEVEEPTACLKAMGPASAFVDVGSLNIGEYDFSLQIGKSIINTGKLTVTPESYELVLNGEAGMNLKTLQLQRVPKNSLWGFIRFQGEADESLARSFITQLTNLGSTQDRFEEGDYGFFEVDAAGKMTQPMVTNERQPFTFLMGFHGDQEEVASLLSEMHRNYGDKVQIRLQMANGREYRSWDLY